MPYTPRTPKDALALACRLLGDITGDCPWSQFGAPDADALPTCNEDCCTDDADGSCWREWLLSGRPCDTDALPPADLVDALETAPGDGARRDGGAVPE